MTKPLPGVDGSTIQCTKTLEIGYNQVCSVGRGFFCQTDHWHFYIGWFIFVQAMMTLSMLMSIFALMAVSVPIMHFALRYNVVMIGLAFILETLACKSEKRVFQRWPIFGLLTCHLFCCIV